MKMKPHVSKGRNSMPKGIIAGVIGSVLVTFASVTIFSGMILREIISEESKGYCAVAILLASVTTGSSIAISKSSNRVRTSLYIGIIYSTILLTVTAILFGAQYQGVGVTIFVVIIGCILTVMLQKNSSKNFKFRKNKIRRC